MELINSFLSQIHIRWQQFDRRHHYFVWLLLVAAVLLRWHQLDPLMSFTFDQGRDMLVLTEMLQGDIRLLGPTTGLQGVFLGPFYYYFLLVGFAIGGGSPLAVAGWSSLWITLGSVLTYYVLRWILPSYWAWLGYILLLLAPGNIEAARLIWNPSLTTMVLAGMIGGLFYSTYQSPRWRWLGLGIGLCCFGLGLRTELAYVIFFTPVVLWWLWRSWDGSLPFLSRQIQFGPGSSRYYAWQTILVGGLIGATTLIPQLLFELKNAGLMTTALIDSFQDSSKQVPYSLVWETRPALMMREISRQLVAWSTDMAPWLWGWWALILPTFFLKKNTRLVFLQWLVVAPLIGLMFYRGNEGAFFNYYLAPHHWIMIIGLVVSGYVWQQADLQKLISLPRSTTQILAIATATLGVATVLSGFVYYLPLITNRDIFQYTIGHQLAALKFVREYQLDQTSPYRGIDVFVPNLQTDQYVFLNDWMNQQYPDLPQVENSITDQHHIYFLIWEPPYRGGSTVAFQEWSKRMRIPANCEPAASFGLVHVDVCERN